MRKKRGELAASFSAGAGHERNEFAVKPGFANQEADRNGDAHPAVVQNIHGQAGTAGCEITVDAKIVVYSCEGGFDRWGLRISLDWESPGMQRAVLFNGQDDPSGRMRDGLCGRIRRKEEQNGKKESHGQRKSG